MNEKTLIPLGAGCPARLVLERLKDAKAVWKHDQGWVAEGDVDLSGLNLTLLPSFKSVGGDFYCYSNQLTSLSGAPQQVGGYFFCHNNRLTSLLGAPQKVGGGFYCHNNQLTSLLGAPQRVGGAFSCHNNKTKLDYSQWKKGQREK